MRVIFYVLSHFRDTSFARIARCCGGADMGNGSAGNTLKATTGSFFAVSWFVLLFFATIVVAMVTLSASQLQGRLLSFSRADTPFSVWQVERIRKQWNAQQAAITRQADKVVKQREVSLEIETSFRESQTKYIILKGSYESSRDEIVAKLRLLNHCHLFRLMIWTIRSCARRSTGQSRTSRPSCLLQRGKRSMISIPPT